MSFSTGPWEWDVGDGEISCESGCVAWVHVHGNVEANLRTAEAFSHADARLIASAPEMYDVIRRLDSMGERFKSTFPETACQIESLLARIDGKGSG